MPHSSDVLTDHLPHGDGLVAYALLQHLAERGHSVHVATQRQAICGVVPANLHLYTVPQTRTGMAGRLQYMLGMRRLFRTLSKTIKFDLLHQTNPVFSGVSLALVDSPLPLVLGTYVASWGKDPNTMTGGDGAMTRLVRAGRDMLAAVQQARASMLLLTGPTACERLPWARSVAGKIRYLPHGVDTQMFAPAVDAAETGLRALFLSNVSLRKGVLPLVRSWAIVLQQMPAARLMVVGDGPDLAAMQRLAAELGVAHAIDFAGSVEHNAVPAVMQRYALYVLPSFGEPYAGSLLEAMSCGLPVVYTLAGGLPDMVPAGGGVGVAMDDPEALAAAMLTLLRDAALRQQMGRINRAAMLATMTWPRVVETLEDYYAELLVGVRP